MAQSTVCPGSVFHVLFQSRDRLPARRQERRADRMVAFLTLTSSSPRDLFPVEREEQAGIVFPDGESQPFRFPLLPPL
jgi:hypothetical protein